jgi:hypothetical protein
MYQFLKLSNIESSLFQFLKKKTERFKNPPEFLKFFIHFKIQVITFYVF